MGELETETYQGKDRRNGNGRLRLAVRDWIALLSLIVTLILFGGNIKWTTVANCKTLEEHTVKIGVIERDIGAIKSDVSYIRGWVDKTK